MSAAANTPKARKPGIGATLLIDYGPLLLFFVTNFAAPVPHAAKIYYATGVFMAAMLAAMAFSWTR
jgi:intracellular septation protein